MHPNLGNIVPEKFFIPQQMFEILMCDFFMANEYKSENLAYHMLHMYMYIRAYVDFKPNDSLPDPEGPLGLSS